MNVIKEIADYIRSGETKKENLGLEIEHFVVDAAGHPIGFNEITALIRKVAGCLSAELHYIDGYPVGYDTGEYVTSLEPSCQFEISIYPFADLSEIERIYREFRRIWDPILKKRGYRIEAADNLPAVEEGKIAVEKIPLSPKKRYKYMDAYFQKSGRFGRHMMRASTSTQISVDYSSEADLVKKLRVLEKIAPILMILTENKAVKDFTLPGNEDKPHLIRAQEWADLDDARTGFLEGSLGGKFGYEKIAGIVSRTPLILLTENGSTTYVGAKSAQDLIQQNKLDWRGKDPEQKKRLIEHFLSMGFFHFRIKKYIEIRVADALPIDEAMGYVALIKGLVYSPENLEALTKELASVNSLDKINEAVEAIMRDGAAAVIYEGLTAAHWMRHLLILASAALDEKDREYLKYVRTTGNDSKQKDKTESSFAGILFA